MALSDSDIKFINESIRDCIPFALVLLPGEEVALKWGGASAEEFATEGNFVISPWLTKFKDSILNLNDGECEPMTIAQNSTSEEEYLREVTGVIESCRIRKGKTVFSRIVCGTTPSDSSWGDIASRIFSEFHSTFRFIYYTPATGGWLGATPEVLLEYDKHSRRFRTMALAGTRTRKDAKEEWDAKNLIEHQFVVDFITETLQPYAQNIEVSEAALLPYGDVEHLLHWISGECAEESLPEILDALSPTPALCGYPTAQAIADITAHESHARGCYGGYLLVDLPSAVVAFVNLRSLHFEGSHYSVFGGGGITGDSIPQEELAETSGKIARLLSAIHSIPPVSVQNN